MDYISKPALMGKLTSSEEQQKIKSMSGADAYNEFLTLVNATEKADVAPVRHELRKAVKLLGKNYEQGLNSDYVRDPVAWALYQTWRQMDRGADNG